MSTIQIDRLLDTVIRQNASDLHLTVGRQPTIRHNGRLRNLWGRGLGYGHAQTLWHLGFVHVHARTIRLLRRLARERGKSVAILQDLQGPKIRTGLLKGGGPVYLRRGAPLVITTRPIKGNAERIATTSHSRVASLSSVAAAAARWRAKQGHSSRSSVARSHTKPIGPDCRWTEPSRPSAIRWPPSA
ncbi:MAG: hypothetical protein IH806_10785 [Proteobacteria bacterium]|nr:hypothetical protein [Pseudomonadota bacterium]